jgi:hypothetical protein
MNFQEKLVEKTEDFRTLATALATRAVETARTRAVEVAQRAQGLKGSLTTLKVAGVELGQVARRHVTRFVEQNTAIARDAGKDVGALARGTINQLSAKPAPARKPRKSPTARKRASRKAA